MKPFFDIVQINAADIESIVAYNLGRHEFVDFVGQCPHGTDFRHIKVSGGHIAYRNAVYIADINDAHQIIVFGFVQCGNIKIRSGSNHTDDLAANQSLCCLRIFHLFPDGHFIAFVD